MLQLQQVNIGAQDLDTAYMRSCMQVQLAKRMLHPFTLLPHAARRIGWLLH